MGQEGDLRGKGPAVETKERESGGWVGRPQAGGHGARGIGLLRGCWRNWPVGVSIIREGGKLFSYLFRAGRGIFGVRVTKTSCVE